MGQSSSSPILSQFKSQLIQENNASEQRFYDLYHCLPASSQNGSSGLAAATTLSGNGTTVPMDGGHTGGGSSTSASDLIHHVLGRAGGSSSSSSGTAQSVTSTPLDYTTLFYYKNLQHVEMDAQNSTALDSTKRHMKWCRSLRHPSIISYVDSSLKSDSVSVTLHPQSPVSLKRVPQTSSSTRSRSDSSSAKEKFQGEQFLMVKGALLPFPDSNLTLREGSTHQQGSKFSSSSDTTATSTSRTITQNAIHNHFTHPDEMTLLTYELAQCLHWLNTQIDITIRPEQLTQQRLTLFYDASARDMRKRILLGNLAGFEKVYTTETHESNKPHTPAVPLQDLRSFETFTESLYMRNSIPYPPIIKDLLTTSSLSHFLSHPHFVTNPFVHVMLFLDDLQTKKLSEKNLFFSQLYHTLREKIDYDLMKRRVLPRLLQETFLIEPNSITFLQHLLTPRTSRHAHIGLLNLDDYKVTVVPFIQHQYSKDGAALRMRLLQTLPYYIHYMSPPSSSSSGALSTATGSQSPSTSPSHHHVTATSEYIANMLIPIISEGLPDTDVQMTQHSATALAECIRYLHSKSSIDGTKMKHTVDFVMQHLYRYATGDSNVSIRSHSLLTMTELFGVPFVDNHMIYSAIREAIYDPVSSEIKIHVLNVILMHQNRFDAKFLLCCVFGMLSHLLLHSEREVRDKARQVIHSISSSINQNGQDSFGMVTLANIAPYLILQERGIDSTKRSKGGGGHGKFSPVVHKRVFKGYAPKLLITDTTSVMGGPSMEGQEHLERPLFVEQLGDSDEEQEERNENARRRHSVESNKKSVRRVAIHSSPRDQDTTDDEDNDSGWDEEFEDWGTQTVSAVPVDLTQKREVKSEPKRKRTISAVRSQKPKANHQEVQRKSTTPNPQQSTNLKARSLKSLKKKPAKLVLVEEEKTKRESLKAKAEEETNLEEAAGAWVDFDLDIQEEQTENGDIVETTTNTDE